MQHEVSYEGSIIHVHVHMHPYGLMYMYIKCQSSQEKDAEQDSKLISLTGLMLYTLTHLPRQLGRLGNKHLTHMHTYSTYITQSIVGEHEAYT